MFKRISVFLPLAMLFLMGGCTVAPSTGIREPLTAVPTVKPKVVVNDGAIYQPGQGMSLFSDRRPRRVGDTLTVNLVEDTQISRKLDNKQNRSGDATFNPTSHVDWTPTSAANTEYKTQLTNNNTFTGSITVTVLAVEPNGNLKVAGQKQVALDHDTQFIRLAGVVNPRDINSDGTIDSTKLADVHLESKSSTGLDSSTLTSLMARFFLAALPF